MKKIVIIFALGLTSCSPSKSPLVVTSVEKHEGESGKYFVEVNKGDLWFYTDSLYKVGDTIK